jgi:hypothetical protein
MLSTLAADPILRRLRAALDELYGERIERVVLFGSRARGEAGEDSDYDVAVFSGTSGKRAFANLGGKRTDAIPASAAAQRTRQLAAMSRPARSQPKWKSLV